MIHDLKCLPEFFQAITDGRKRFELRRADRPFALGDMLRLREFDQEHALYTGAVAVVEVSYILRGSDAMDGSLNPGYCIMSIRKPGLWPTQ